EGRPYRGVLYAGMMITPKGEPMTLEFNCRFGDPETQPLMMRMESDLLPLLLACAKADGTLASLPLTWDARAATCVVVAAEGYPGDPKSGEVVTGLGDAAKVAGAKVFHAGTRIDGGRVVTSGGRVFGVTGLAADPKAAAAVAYQ